IVETGERMGKQMGELITDMTQPLGRMVGNALEVQECIEVLHGGGPADLRELCLELAAWMFYLGGASKTVAEGKQLSAQIIASGKAFERFRQMVELQGGDISAIDDPTRLPGTDHRVEVPSPKAGYVVAIACEQVGTACVILGGGRQRQENSVDPSVGVCGYKKIGDKVAAGGPPSYHYLRSAAHSPRGERPLREE